MISTEHTNTLLEKCNVYNDQWPQWRKDLYNNGWAVIPNVVDRDRCTDYKNRFWQWFEDFNTGINRNNPATWSDANWPHAINGIIHQYSFGQNQFVWDIRSEQAIIDAFTQIYNTDQLLVSFDGGNLSRPTRKETKPWEHFDQGSNKLGFRCVQGFLNLMDCEDDDGGLVVYEKSHELHSKYFKENNIVCNGDWYRLPSDPKLRAYFNGCKKVKVNCKAGDLVVWDSQCLHYAVAPTTKNCRMVVYVSYQPAFLITPDALAKKQEIFYEKRMTSHWAAENINMFTKDAKNIDNSHRSKFRYDDTTLPVLTDRAKQLAGLIPYFE